MIRKLIVAAVVASLCSGTAMAANGPIEVIWTGTIVDAQNAWILLGQRAQDYVGASFDARLVIDPSRGNTPTPGWAYGGPQNGDLSPVLSDTVTAAGVTFSHSNSYFSQVYTSESGSSSTFQTIIEDGVPGTPNYFGLTFQVVDPGDFGYGAPSFGPWDGDVTGASSNTALIFMTDADGNEGYLEMRNTHLTIRALAVPEPASWAMIVAGFGLAGAAMRRQRKTLIRFT